MTSYSELLEPVVQIAEAAASKILDVYSGDFSVDQKQDDSPVTKADLAASELIVAGLSELTPEWPVLSEEGNMPSFEERKNWQRYWLVDPLDGTRGFIKRNGEFTVNIALIEEGQPVLGVVQVPVKGTIYFACRGAGAFIRDKQGETTEIKTKSWDGGWLVIAGSRSHMHPAFHEFMQHFPDCEVLSLGSSLKSCYVAEGRADIHVRLGSTSEWDTAAAQCLVEEAGGQVTDINMQPLRYNTKESLLNPPFLVFGDPSHRWNQYVPEL